VFRELGCFGIRGKRKWGKGGKRDSGQRELLYSTVGGRGTREQGGRANGERSGIMIFMEEIGG
jgi:hypothetical protein